MHASIRIPMAIASILLHQATAASVTCPEKFSTMLCRDLPAKEDSAFFQVRIVLDASQEPVYYKTEKRPMLVWTEHLMANYELRSLENADSNYNPTIISINPEINSVRYHNVSARKSEIARMVSEPYIKSVERGCNRKISHALCSEMNDKEDSALVSFKIYLQDSLRRDTVKFDAYLRKLPLRDPKETGKILSAEEAVRLVSDGYSATVGAFRQMSWDREIRFLELWHEQVPAYSSRRVLSMWTVPQGRGSARYQLDGRLIPPGTRAPFPAKNGFAGRARR